MKNFINLLLTFVTLMISGIFSAFGSFIGATDNLPIANATAHNIRSLHEFHFKKSTMQKLYKNYGDGFNTLDLLRTLNRWDMVSNETMTYEEEGYDIRTITMAATVTLSGTPGGNASFVLHADDLDSAYHYYPRKGFIVMTGDVINGFIQGRIEDITGTGTSTVTITIKPVDAAKTFTSNHVAIGKEVGIFDSAFGVETGQPVGTSKGYWERTFYAQIFKETLTFGGMELAKQKWVEVEGVGFFNKELARTEFNLDRQEESALLMGQSGANLSDTSLITGATVPVYKNKGVWTWIDELGGEMTYANTSGPSFDDLDEAAAYLEANGINDDIVFVLAGGNMYRKLETMSIDWWVDPTGSGTPHGAMTTDFLKKSFGADGGLEIDVTFKAIKKSSILFVLYKLPAFTNPYQFGIPGYMLTDAAILLPMTKVRDGKSGITIPNLSANYVGINGYSRQRIVAPFAGMDGFHNQKSGDPIISQIDGNNTYWMSHVMFPFVEAFKGMLWRRSA